MLEIKQELLKHGENIEKALKRGSDVEIRKQKDGSLKIIEVKKNVIQ